MGKAITFMLILVMVDLMLISTGMVTLTINSIILNAIVNITNLNGSDFFNQFIGDLRNLVTSGAGLAAIVTGLITGVATGVFLSVSDTKYFIPMAIALGLLANDFVAFAIVLEEMKVPSLLMTFIIAPIVVSFVMVLIEWARGRD